MNLSKGWGFVLGTFLGFQIAKLRDHMPMIVQSVSEMRSLMGGECFPIHEVEDDEAEDGSDDE